MYGLKPVPFELTHDVLKAPPCNTCFLFPNLCVLTLLGRFSSFRILVRGGFYITGC